MTLSQQIALGILTSVLGAALWEFLNHVYPEIKKSLGNIAAACYRALSKIFSSFKKTASLIRAKLNIDYFVEKVVQGVLSLVVGVCKLAYICFWLFLIYYQVNRITERHDTFRTNTFATAQSGTCECAPLPQPIGGPPTYSSLSPRYRPQPNDIIFTAPTSSDFIVSEGTPVDCSSARKGRKSKQPRKRITIEFNNSGTLNSAPRRTISQ